MRSFSPKTAVTAFVALFVMFGFVSGKATAEMCGGTPCVDTTDIIDGQVTTSDLAEGAVDTSKLKDGSVTGAKVQDESLTGADVLDGSLKGTDIKNYSVGGADIATGAVNSSHIADKVVKGADLADGAVDSDKILDGSVSSADVGFYYAGSSTKGGIATNTNKLDGLNSTDFARRNHTVDATELPCEGNSPNDIMVKVGPLCVDKYEASVWSVYDGTGTQYGATADDYYPSTFPGNGNWTWPLYAVSKPGVPPSRFITWFQAEQACALSGKRLLTNAEWQRAAAGTPDTGTTDLNAPCNIFGTGPVNTGSKAGCVSNWGVSDMVGNLQEWVERWMEDNSHIEDGVITIAEYENDGLYGVDDADPVAHHFPAAPKRGGHWLDGTKAGVFALGAGDGPTKSGDTIGFRCAR